MDPYANRAGGESTNSWLSDVRRLRFTQSYPGFTLGAFKPKVTLLTSSPT